MEPRSLGLASNRHFCKKIVLVACRRCSRQAQICYEIFHGVQMSAVKLNQRRCLLLPLSVPRIARVWPRGAPTAPHGLSNASPQELARNPPEEDVCAILVNATRGTQTGTRVILLPNFRARWETPLKELPYEESNLEGHTSMPSLCRPWRPRSTDHPLVQQTRGQIFPNGSRIQGMVPGCRERWSLRPMK